MAENSINNRYKLLVIGGSAGSLEVVMPIVQAIPKDTSLAIVIVMHRKNTDSILVDLLAQKTSLPVSEAEEKEPVAPGQIFLAPADYHLLIEKDRTFSLDFSEKLHYSRPGIDATFETAADAYGASLICILLSGANADGTAGLKKAKEAGALIIIQDPAEAMVSYMPQQAMAAVEADYILKLPDMITMINSVNR
jgi:two-component system, chemotaxis family, protein-glutamate methylesterase/glutaminase